MPRKDLHPIVPAYGSSAGLVIVAGVRMPTMAAAMGASAGVPAMTGSVCAPSRVPLTMRRMLAVRVLGVRVLGVRVSPVLASACVTGCRTAATTAMTTAAACSRQRSRYRPLGPTERGVLGRRGCLRNGALPLDGRFLCVFRLYVLIAVFGERLIVLLIGVFGLSLVVLFVGVFGLSLVVFFIAIFGERLIGVFVRRVCVTLVFPARAVFAVRLPGLAERLVQIRAVVFIALFTGTLAAALPIQLCGGRGARGAFSGWGSSFFGIGARRPVRRLVASVRGLGRKPCVVRAIDVGCCIARRRCPGSSRRRSRTRIAAWRWGAASVSAFTEQGRPRARGQRSAGRVTALHFAHRPGALPGRRRLIGRRDILLRQGRHRWGVMRRVPIVPRLVVMGRQTTAMLRVTVRVPTRAKPRGAALGMDGVQG